MRAFRNLSSAAFACVFVLSQAPAAHAQGDIARAERPAKPDLVTAKKHYLDGMTKFRDGDFAGALADFRTANDIMATPEAERNIGRSFDALGQYRSASEWYGKFLAHAPAKMAGLAEKTRARDAEIRAMPGKVHVESTPQGATITIDGKPQGASAPTDVDLAPGPHHLALAQPGRPPAEKSIEVGFASVQTVTATFDADSAAASPVPPAVAAALAPASPTDAPADTTVPAAAQSASPSANVPAYVTAGVAVLAAGIGIAYGALALSDKSTSDQNPSSQADADSLHSHALTADVAFGASLVSGIASLMLFLSNHSSAPSPASAAATSANKPRGALTITPTAFAGGRGGGASVALSF